MYTCTQNQHSKTHDKKSLKVFRKKKKSMHICTCSGLPVSSSLKEFFIVERTQADVTKAQSKKAEKYSHREQQRTEAKNIGRKVINRMHL